MEKTDILGALDAAIRGEEEAQAFYLTAAGKTDDPKGSEMFRQLAEFEGHHKRHLEELRESLASGGAWVSYEGRTLSELPKAKIEGGSGPAPGAHSDALEALRVAIAAEEKAEAEYRAMAKRAPDEAGREMFEKLAAEESMHRRLLDDQFFALSSHGMWLWGD